MRVVKHNGIIKPVPDRRAKHNGIIKPVQKRLVKVNGSWLMTYQNLLVREVAAGSSSVVLSQYFNADEWAKAKKLVVNPPGVELTAANRTHALMTTIAANGQAGSFGGELTVENYGIISGRGGILGPGGDVILGNFKGRDGQKLKLINKPGGIIRAGGGRGGPGGQGGPGLYQSPYTYTEGQYLDSGHSAVFNDGNSGRWAFRWGYALVGGQTWPSSSFAYGGWTYQVGSFASSGTGGGGDEQYSFQTYYVYRYQTRYNPIYTQGGLGGAPGRGRGCDGADAPGSPGVAGGQNAGTGALGGRGGDWGLPGVKGATGNTGNNGGGSVGADGSPAGFYLNGLANIDFINEPGGIVLGRIQ